MFYVHRIVSIFILVQSCAVISEANSNIAFQKPSNQTEDVVYNGWIWSADKAVDGCTDSDDPNNQECCSTSLPTQGQAENRWSVFLLQFYVIDYIIVIGRSDGNTDTQLSGFELFYHNGSAEAHLYTNTGDFGNGTFFIRIDPPVTASAIILKRPDVLTLCEVEVYGAAVTTSTTEDTTTFTPLTTAVSRYNVALNQRASQAHNSTWNGWTWTADYAVDGCTLANDPDNQRCCSTSAPAGGQPNWWRLDFDQKYVISEGVITGRSDMSLQLEGFQMFYEFEGSETLLYDNLGVEYGTGVFTITIDPPVTANAIIVRRAGMITLCEVEILGVPAPAPTTSSTAQTTEATEQTTSDHGETIPAPAPTTSSTAQTTEATEQTTSDHGETTTATSTTSTSRETVTTPSTTTVARSNIALNQRATQTHNSTWNGWTWTADYAVDGCKLADKPDDQQCCSTSDDGWNLPNWWRVDFDQYYLIDEGVITGRSDTSNQMEGFTVFYDSEGSETLLYDNTGVNYGTGVFTITINPPVVTNAIIVRRTGILTLCEVEIFGVPAPASTTSTVAYTTETTETTTQPTETTQSTEQTTETTVTTETTEQSTAGTTRTSQDTTESTILTTAVARSNIALNQRASQTHNSTWNGWTWTADHAVDGCDLADNPDFQYCCSTSDPGFGQPNWWRVDFDQYYLIDEGVITGRSDTSNQMEGFSVFYDNDGSETLLYNNIGVEYGTGVFTITINPPVITNAIIVRRTGILTLCEVEIFGIPAPVSTTSTLAHTAETTETTTQPEQTETTEQMTEGATSISQEPTTTSTASTTTAVARSNIALNRRASQTHNSTWNGWTWTADHAVDGCSRADDPDNQYCCSTSDIGYNQPNWWRVDFDRYYRIDEGIITGRSDMSTQLQDFTLSYESEGSETQIYDNSGVEYGTGVFIIAINPPVSANAIIIRRIGTLTLCEVEIFGVPAPLPTTSTTEAAATTATTDVTTEVTTLETTETTAMTITSPDTTSSTTITTAVARSNIALNQQASQPHNVTWNGWTWTADYAVDGCILANDPDNQQCCSTSDPGVGVSNWWRVDFDQYYSIDEGVIIGRSDSNTQMQDFQMFYDKDGSEVLLFDQTGVDYGQGVFTIPINPPVTTNAIIIRRDGTLTLCEVEIFGVPAPASTTSTATTTETTVTTETTEQPSETTITTQQTTSDTVETTAMTTSTSQDTSTSTPITTAVARSNIALNQRASQPHNVTWNGWTWTADYAVNGCILADDPDNQQCCSTSDPGVGVPNWWRVDFDQYYIIDEGVITGRSDSNTQMQDFQMFYDDGTTEVLLFDQTGKDYGQGVFTIPINPPVTTNAIIIRRDGTLTLCEVEIYGVPAPKPTTPTIETTIYTSEISTYPTTREETTTFTDTFTTTLETTTFADTTTTALYTTEEVTAFTDSTSTTIETSTFADTSFTTLETTTFTGISSTTLETSSFADTTTFTLETTTGEITTFADTTTTTIETTTVAPDTTVTTFDTESTTSETTETTSEITTAVSGTNIALNQRASQAHNSTWNGWTWTADHAVDGCSLADNPDYQYCCSTSNPGAGFSNWWRVDLDQYYIINEGVVTGRSDVQGADQLQGFTMYNENGGTETRLYDNTGVPYGQGVFTIPINPPVTANAIIIRKTGIMTLCEVEIHGVPATTSTGATDTPTAPTTTSTIINSETSSTTAATRTNVALNQRASQTHNSTWNGWTWTADHAVDGCKLADDPDNQNCCSTSNVGWNMLNWWRVDFDRYYIVDEGVIIGRSDTSNQLEGFTMSYESGGSETQVYDNTGIAYGSGVFTIPINPPVAANAIIIKRTGTLTLCEVEIFGVPATTGPPSTDLTVTATSTITQTDSTSTTAGTGTTSASPCPEGFWGPNCVASCGQCSFTNSCDKYSGNCPHGCESGWTGGPCDTECPDGSYGQDCLGSCGSCAGGNAACNHVDGTCDAGCSPGWTTGLCNQECPDGNYGQNCAWTCGSCAGGNAACNHVDGTCAGGCSPGWTTGLCNQECPDGSYGQDCAWTCGSCAGGNAACNHVDGTCAAGCSLGWTTALCNQACQAGTYGQDCFQQCGFCRPGDNCNHVDGSCPNGCADGWTGATCHDTLSTGSVSTTIASSTSTATESTSTATESTSTATESTSSATESTLTTTESTVTTTPSTTVTESPSTPTQSSSTSVSTATLSTSSTGSSSITGLTTTSTSNAGGIHTTTSSSRGSAGTGTTTAQSTSSTKSTSANDQGSSTTGSGQSQSSTTDVFQPFYPGSSSRIVSTCAIYIFAVLTIAFHVLHR